MKRSKLHNKIISILNDLAYTEEGAILDDLGLSESQEHKLLNEIPNQLSEKALDLLNARITDAEDMDDQNCMDQVYMMVAALFYQVYEKALEQIM